MRVTGVNDIESMRNRQDGDVSKILNLWEGMGRREWGRKQEKGEDRG